MADNNAVQDQVSTIPDETDWSTEFDVPAGLIDDAPAGGIVMLGDVVEFGELEGADFGPSGIVARAMEQVQALEATGVFALTDDELLRSLQHVRG